MVPIRAIARWGILDIAMDTLNQYLVDFSKRSKHSPFLTVSVMDVVDILLDIRSEMVEKQQFERLDFTPTPIGESLLVG